MAQSLPDDLVEQRQLLFAPPAIAEYDTKTFERIDMFVSNVWKKNQPRSSDEYGGSEIVYCYCRCKSDASRKPKKTRGLRKREHFVTGCSATMRLYYTGSKVVVVPGKPHDSHDIDYMDSRGMSDALRNPHNS